MTAAIDGEVARVASKDLEIGSTMKVRRTGLVVEDHQRQTGLGGALIPPRFLLEIHRHLLYMPRDLFLNLLLLELRPISFARPQATSQQTLYHLLASHASTRLNRPFSRLPPPQLSRATASLMKG